MSPPLLSSPDAYDRWRELLASESLPAAMVDLDAASANLSTVLSGLTDSHVSIRLVARSLGCPALLRWFLAQGHPRVRGLMTHDPGTTAMLLELGFSDLLLTQPLTRLAEVKRLATLAGTTGNLTLVVDSVEHVELLEQAFEETEIVLPVCIELDLSLMLGGDFRFGFCRSPIRSPEQARTLARRISEGQGLELKGILAYESQLAGVATRHANSRIIRPVGWWVERRSRPQVLDLRRAVVEVLRADGHALPLVNGGGSGSMSFTSTDPSVTEISLGTSFLWPARQPRAELPLVPAIFFALGVVRRPDSSHVTCAGGGYISPGPVGLDRTPSVLLPQGLQIRPFEGWGATQTPFQLLEDSARLQLGDPVICRPASAAILAERFDRYLLVQNGEISDRAPTFKMFGASLDPAG